MNSFKTLSTLVKQHPYISLWIAALAFRLVTALIITEPGFIDAYYYYQIAQNWHDGKGLTEVTIWNYQAGGQFDPANGLDHTAFTYWTPLSSLLIIGSFSLFGVSYGAAALPFILCATALPLLAYWLGKLIFGATQQRYSWLMALAMLFPGRFFVYWNSTDNFAPFALIMLLGLIFTYLGLYRRDYWLLAAGAMGGLAYLSRSDGSLFTVALVISFWWVRRHKPTDPAARAPRWIMLGLALLVALLVVSPWLIRNLAQFGSILPANNAKVLFLRNYTDFFSYSLPLDANYYFSWGVGNLLLNKIQNLLIDAVLIIFQGLFFLGPFFVVGAWMIRKQAVYLPFLVYTAVLYFVMALGFSEIGSHGTIFHSTGGLIPFQAACALVVFDWLKQHRFRLRWVPIIMTLTIVGTVYFAYAGEAADWDSSYKTALILEPWFEHNAVANDVIMIADPLSFNYATGRPAMAEASDGLTANLTALQHYGAHWLVLEKVRYTNLDDLYKNKQAAGQGVSLQLAAELDQGIQIYKVIPTP